MYFFYLRNDAIWSCVMLVNAAYTNTGMESKCEFTCAGHIFFANFRKSKFQKLIARILPRWLLYALHFQNQWMIMHKNKQQDLLAMKQDLLVEAEWRIYAIIWKNAWILSIRPLAPNFNDILIKIHTYSFKKMHMILSLGKWRPFCVGLNVLNMSQLRE